MQYRAQTVFGICAVFVLGAFMYHQIFSGLFSFSSTLGTRQHLTQYQIDTDTQTTTDDTIGIPQQLQTQTQTQTQQTRTRLTRTQLQGLIASQTQQTTQTPKPLADGCHTVYLDLGTNIGIQIRKVYEPQLFEQYSKTKDQFNQYFGINDRRHVCSFGWEPNPRHVPWLSHQESVYRSLGYRTHIFTTSGVYDRDTIAEFESDNRPQDNEWAGKVKPKQEQDGQGQTTTTTTTTNTNTEKYQVHLFNFGEWFKTNVISRSIPESEIATLGAPKIVMKLDVEGPDWQIASQLVHMGLWCSLDFVYQEHLTFPQQDFLNRFHVTGCKTKQTQIDDETYHTARFPFPSVSASAAASAAWLDRFPLPPQWDTNINGPRPTHAPDAKHNN